MGELPVACVTAFETSSAADSMSTETAFVLQSRGRRCHRGVNTWTLGTADDSACSTKGPAAWSRTLPLFSASEREVRWFRRPVMQPRQQHCNRNGLSPGEVPIEPRW